jgi:putative membrane protein
MFEIQAGQLALQRSTNPAVRSLAQMLVTDHTALANQLAAAAQAGGVTAPPPAMLPEAQQMWTQLQSASPQMFDTTFRDLVIQEHQHGIPMFQNYASNGDNAALRSAASQALPTLQKHLAAAQALAIAPPPPPRRSGERG